ncbi:multidrug resistance-associated protein 5 [Plakobranchus ocellatus]|uniref:Multidrug resistance-associated protein 5 n=1 Tax=Plakobranchus ocellatus TaxID=259542 RepID=A0AAV3Z189_9GAST|nr:multidrug resistance-associated protein 5 [Plakobranchus ocellatus]
MKHIKFRARSMLSYGFGTNCNRSRKILQFRKHLSYRNDFQCSEKNRLPFRGRFSFNLKDQQSAVASNLRILASDRAGLVNVGSSLQLKGFNLSPLKSRGFIQRL